MNILMLGPWLPTTRRPLVNERMHQFARHLAKEHRLTLACVTDHPNPIGAVSVLREQFDDLEFAVVPNRWKRLWSVARLAAGSSAEVASFSSAALRTRLHDRLRTTPFDLVYVTSTSMIPYALDLVPAVPVILDLGNLDSEWWLERSRRFSGLKAKVYAAEANRLRSVEIMGARHAIRCLVATPQAARLVTAFAPSADVTVIAEGLDPDDPAPPHRPGAPLTIAFSPCLERNAEAGAAAEFCDTVLPRVRARAGPTTLLIGCTSLFPLARRLANLPDVEVAAPTSNLRALLRRAAPSPTPLRLRVGRLELDFAAREVTVGGKRRVLTHHEFELLATLARASGRVLSREQILEALKGESEPFDRSIDVHVAKLRAKLEPDPKEPRYIKTVRGVGYMLAREVD